MPTKNIYTIGCNHTKFALSSCLLALVLVLDAYFYSPLGHRNSHKGLLLFILSKKGLLLFILRNFMSCLSRIVFV